MKKTIVTLCAILAVTTARVVINIEGQDTPHLLGAKACTWGVSYWCQNITTSAKCNATKYCIPQVWEKVQVPEDYDSVCQICKNMVLQARDQLESNQTQQDLKNVFEGSCALIYFKPIIKECDKLVDEFIPELVETLASQMNPSVVCSIAGLCNSAYIDKLLEEFKNQTQDKEFKVPISLMNDEYNPSDCKKCYTIVHHMEYKFRQASRDNVLEQLISICGEFSSFSDACASIILTHFETIYLHLKSNFNARGICHISGQCSDKFHVHEDNINKTLDVEIRPLSTIGMVEISDDLPCKLCEQLVGHLRDLLIANTTEMEFQQVLEGICKQTKSFAVECKTIIEEYYSEIYSFLTKGLNTNIICQMGGMCPAPGKQSGPIWPMVSDSHASIAKKIIKEKEIESKVLEMINMQLPIERMAVSLTGFLMVNNKYCPSCEFVMDYIKKTVKDLKNRNELKLALSEIKSNLPEFKYESEEDSFLSKYELAISELILQDKDFSEICSLIAVCPTNKQIEVWKHISSHFIEKSLVQNKPSCSLCLYAISKIYELIEDDRTEIKIEAALNNLCNELPKSLNRECIDLVKIYSKELIQLLVNDMAPREVCSYIKLCESSQYIKNKHQLSSIQNTIAVPKNSVENKEVCALCEYLLHYIQQAITNPKAEDEVKQVIDKICKKLPETVQNNCNEFVDTYGSALVAIIAQEIDPSQICPMIHICPSVQLVESWNQIPIVKYIETEDKPNCPLCLFGVTQLYNAIKDNKTEASIENALEKLCIHLPKSLTNQCEAFVKIYSKQIIEMILADFTPQEVCVYLQLCDPQKNVESSMNFFLLDKKGEIESVAECALCLDVISNIEMLLDNPDNNGNIEEVMPKVCKYIIASEREKCKMLIDTYEKNIINIVKVHNDRTKICSKLSFCASKNFLLMLIKNGRFRRQTDDKNLGTKPCTWGISYWCVDDKTAEECKATELCKKKGRLPETTSTTVKVTSDNREVASEAEKAVSEDAQSSS